MCNKNQETLYDATIMTSPWFRKKNSNLKAPNSVKAEMMKSSQAVYLLGSTIPFDITDNKVVSIQFNSYAVKSVDQLDTSGAFIGFDAILHATTLIDQSGASPSRTLTPSAMLSIGHLSA